MWMCSRFGVSGRSRRRRGADGRTRSARRGCGRGSRNAVRVGAADPGKVRVVEVRRTSSIFTCACPSAMLPTCSAMSARSLSFAARGEIGAADAGVIEHDVVLPSLGEVVVAGLRDGQDRLLALRFVERLITASPLACSACRILGALYLPERATTGSEPTKAASSPPDRRARSS